MKNILAREFALVVLAGLLFQWWIPSIVGVPSAGTQFLFGVAVGLTFMPVYAMTALGGSRAPARVHAALGTIAGISLLPIGGMLRAGLEPLPGAASYLAFLPALWAVLAVGIASVTSAGSDWFTRVSSALFFYGMPMVGVRWLLAPMVADSPLLMLSAVQVGAVTMFLRVVFRLLWPTAVEGNEAAPPLVHRPVPDTVVGIVEGTTKMNARPWATLPTGDRDPNAISLLCHPDEAARIVVLLTERLGTWPLDVHLGESTAGRVEVVVRPRKDRHS